MERKIRQPLYKQVDVDNGRIVGISDADLSDFEKEHYLHMSQAAFQSFDPYPFPPNAPYNMRTTVIPPHCYRGHLRTPVEPFIDIVRKVEPVTYWFSHSSAARMENLELMKMYLLWPVFMQASNNTTTFLRTKDPRSLDLSIKDLNFIELLEDLAELYKKVSEQHSFVEGAFKIGCNMEKARYKIKNVHYTDAMLWVKSAGEEVLYKRLKSQEKICSRVLQSFFTEYTFFFIKMAEDHRLLSDEVKLQMCDSCELEAEDHRSNGKDYFEEGEFRMAEKVYNEALLYSPENHILFSNRALCYIRMHKYGKALSDGKKAIILKNTWPKGHYRFCEALFALGEMDRAIASNEKAQKLCKDSPEGIKDLIQQHSRFTKLMKEAEGVKQKKCKKKGSSDKNIGTQDVSSTDKENKSMQTAVAEEPPAKEATNTASVGTEVISESSSVTQSKKGKSKGKTSEPNDRKSAGTKNVPKEAQKILSPTYTQLDLETVTNLVKSNVREACEALSDQRCHNAEKMFSQVLEILSQLDIQSLHLAKIDHVVLMYGHANSLLGIRKLVELTRAEVRFREIIQLHSKERFNCLAFYGLGNVYLKQNRFSDALGQYVKSKTMLKHKMVPGVLTWPTTSVVVEETRPERLEVLLNNCIEECKFPPKADAICRFEHCLSLPKIQIYFTDPDFKGFIRMVCCQLCVVEFHVCCWRKLKATVYSDKNDKDFLRFSCLTPDCGGAIIHIVIYDSTGDIKCEFEHKVVKKPKKQMKNKATSTKKLKAKHENKAEKKAIDEEHVDQPNDAIRERPSEKILPDPVVTNGYHIPGDPLLSQVMRKQKLIISGCPVSLPQFWDTLTAWRVISVQELNELDFNANQPSQTNSRMKNLLHNLYKLNDRVKTRVLLYLLKVHQERISSDLNKWICMVDEKGLQAAEEFRLHNEDHLKVIKPQDIINLWNQSYGKNLNHEISDSFFNTLSSMNINCFRCFVWFLEENRNIESVATLGKELDKYFQEMDVPCGKVPAYSLEEICSKGPKIKPKHRKKKQNQPKPILKLSGAVSTRSQDDDIFTEENTLSLLDPYEPFGIPEFLRRDLVEFQSVYDPVWNRLPVVVEDSMDPVRETLYEYFSQILEEHGPLSLDDEILIGEYKTFPAETRRMVEASGGLKEFLLESYLFTMDGDLVSLLGYDVSHSELYEERRRLNPTAEEFRPSFSNPLPDNIDLYCDPGPMKTSHFSSSASDSSQRSTQHSDITFNYTEYSDIHNNLDHRTLDNNPNSETDLDYEDDDEDDDNDSSDEESTSSSSDSESSVDQEDVAIGGDKPISHENLYTNHVDSNIIKSPDRKIRPRFIQTAIVSVQVNTEISHCEVNTDAFHPFESQQGDILRMEKEQTALIDQLKEATEKYQSLKSRFKEEMASLEALIKETTQNNKITKTELKLLQQDHDNVSKKWNQTRKENQDIIKTLKNNIKTTAEANDRCSRSIEEKKKQYEAYIKDFAKIHCSKFDREKATLEKNIKKYEAEMEETRQRAMAAEVIVLENRKQCELLKLRMKASTVDRNISMFNPLAIGNPAPHIVQQMQEMESVKHKLRKEMDTIQAQFDKQINSLKSGLTLNKSPVSDLHNPPSASDSHIRPPPSQAKSPPPTLTSSKLANPAPAKPPMKETAAVKKVQAKEAKKTSAPAKPKNPPPVTSSNWGAAGQERRPQAQPTPTLLSPAKPTVFDKIIHELHDIFPHYKNAELAAFIKDFRARNNGTLTGLTHEDIISRVTEYILDFQAKNPSPPSLTPAAFKTGAAMPQPVSPQPKQPWKVVNLGAKNKWQKPNELESLNEDPCIICHDELKQYPVHKLDCGHCFHKECIKTWLNTQSTCPTCREHALLPEDFPALCGRMRNV